MQMMNALEKRRQEDAKSMAFDGTFVLHTGPRGVGLIAVPSALSVIICYVTTMIIRRFKTYCITIPRIVVLSLSLFS